MYVIIYMAALPQGYVCVQGNNASSDSIQLNEWGGLLHQFISTIALPPPSVGAAALQGPFPTSQPPVNATRPGCGCP